jgi:hypothetical protein
MTENFNTLDAYLGTTQLEWWSERNDINHLVTKGLCNHCSLLLKEDLIQLHLAEQLVSKRYLGNLIIVQ